MAKYLQQLLLQQREQFALHDRGVMPVKDYLEKTRLSPLRDRPQTALGRIPPELETGPSLLRPQSAEPTAVLLRHLTSTFATSEGDPPMAAGVNGASGSPRHLLFDVSTDPSGKSTAHYNGSHEQGLQAALDVVSEIGSDPSAGEKALMLQLFDALHSKMDNQSLFVGSPINSTGAPELDLKSKASRKNLRQNSMWEASSSSSISSNPNLQVHREDSGVKPDLNERMTLLFSKLRLIARAPGVYRDLVFAKEAAEHVNNFAMQCSKALQAYDVMQYIEEHFAHVASADRVRILRLTESGAIVDGKNKPTDLTGDEFAALINGGCPLFSSEMYVFPLASEDSFFGVIQIYFSEDRPTPPREALQHIRSVLGGMASVAAMTIQNYIHFEMAEISSLAEFMIDRARTSSSRLSTDSFSAR